MDKDLRLWNRLSKFYTVFHERGNKRLYQNIGALSLEYVLGKNVLELGCGTGQITKELSFKSARYIATDYSPKMIEQCRKRDLFNANLMVADATSLDFLDSSFDVVIIANTLHVMKDSDKAMAEIKRVLKPGGILIAPTFIYDGRVNRLRLYLLKLIGFNSYHKWTLKEYNNYLKSFGFTPRKLLMLDSKPLSEGYAVLTKNMDGEDSTE